jgi:hypothetical protein
MGLFYMWQRMFLLQCPKRKESLTWRQRKPTRKYNIILYISMDIVRDIKSMITAKVGDKNTHNFRKNSLEIRLLNNAKMDPEIIW